MDRIKVHWVYVNPRSVGPEQIVYEIQLITSLFSAIELSFGKGAAEIEHDSKNCVWRIWCERSSSNAHNIALFAKGYVLGWKDANP